MGPETAYAAAVLLASGAVAVAAGWLWSTDLDLSGRLFVLLIGLHPPLGVLVAAELLAPTRDLSVLFYALHTGIGVAVPLIFLLFAFVFTGGRRTLPRWLSGSVAAYALVIAGLDVTNPIHGLARTEYRVVGETVPHLTATPTTAFMVLTLPAIMAYYGAMGILSYRLLARGRGQWKRTTALLVGFLSPGVVTTLWFAGLLPGPMTGGFVFGSVWMTAFAGWAVFQYRLFDVVPLARDAVFEALDEMVVVVDEDRRLLDYNTSAAETFPQVTGSEGRLLDDLIPPLVDDGTDGSPSVAAEGSGTSDPFVSSFTWHDADPREFSVRTSQVGAGDRLRGYAVVMSDVTDRQRQIRELQRQKSQLERFASTLSHDIRNPLNVARGKTELVIKRDGNDGLTPVLDALDRIERIIEDLLTLSREGRTIDERQRVALADVAAEAWRNTETGAATFEIDLDADVVLYADRTRLLNVFENLFRNALEHGSTGSRTGSGDDASRADAGGLTITLGRHDDGFYVEDDGPGIPPEERDAVFEYEYTTADGTGLGLAIVDAIAEAHGWTVAAGEGADGGARIAFDGVDLVDATADPVPEEPSEVDPSLST
jgi:signal transduction histidine kinase